MAIKSASILASDFIEMKAYEDSRTEKKTGAFAKLKLHSKEPQSEIYWQKLRRRVVAYNSYEYTPRCSLTGRMGNVIAKTALHRFDLEMLKGLEKLGVEMDKVPLDEYIKMGRRGIKFDFDTVMFFQHYIKVRLKMSDLAHARSDEPPRYSPPPPYEK